MYVLKKNNSLPFFHYVVTYYKVNPSFLLKRSQFSACFKKYCSYRDRSTYTIQAYIINYLLLEFILKHIILLCNSNGLNSKPHYVTVS